MLFMSMQQSIYTQAARYLMNIFIISLSQPKSMVNQVIAILGLTLMLYTVHGKMTTHSESFHIIIVN